MHYHTQTTGSWHDGWSAVDTSQDPAFFVRFLDRSRKKPMRAAYANPDRYFAHLDLKPGLRVLDVGCGTGELLHPLDALVGPGGRVVGVDASVRMIEEARSRAQGKLARVEYQVGDACALDFPDGSFDRCMAESVFQHLPDPVRAMEEAVRVLRSGGLLSITEADWETQVVDAADGAVTRKILNFFCDNIRNGWIARRLFALFHDRGLQDVDVTSFTVQMTGTEIAAYGWLEESARRATAAGIVSEQQAEAWLADLQERIHRGRFFEAYTVFRVRGRKP